MWQDLFDQWVDGELDRPPAVSIDAAFDRWEAQLGLPLPASYRAFIHQFGPGQLFGWFRFYAPLIEGVAASRQMDSVEQHDMWKDPDGYWAESGDPALVARFVFLCDSGGGDAYFWDPQEISDPERHEYAVYELPDNTLKGEVTRVALSFPEFVREFCLKTTWPKLVYEDDQRQEYWSLWRG